MNINTIIQFNLRHKYKILILLLFIKLDLLIDLYHLSKFKLTVYNNILNTFYEFILENYITNTFFIIVIYFFDYTFFKDIFKYFMYFIKYFFINYLINYIIYNFIKLIV